MLLLALMLGCRVELGPPGGPVVAQGDAPQGEVWIYTSMYQSVIDELEPQIEALWPEVDARFYQAGSEKVAQRAEAEWDAGGTKACLLMTSDPFWYADLAERGLLQRHFAPNVLHVDRSLLDPDGYWATARISLMVMAANETVVPADERPERFTDLVDPAWKDRFSMGDPLASGTMFTTLSFFVDAEGWDHVRALRDNGLIAAGGNSSVLTRIETGEREVGILLLENLLAAAAKDTPAVPIYPADGAIPVPGPIALTAGCRNPVAARAIYDFMLSPEGQQAMVDGNMYAALREVPPPPGAPPLSEIPLRTWPDGFADRVSAERADIKERYAALVAESP